jgi:hypothetical protein
MGGLRAGRAGAWALGVAGARTTHTQGERPGWRPGEGGGEGGDLTAYNNAVSAAGRRSA